MAEAVLSVSLDLLFEKLSPSEIVWFARQENLQTHIEIWKERLVEISKLLNDAEEKQINHWAVKAWLSDLKDLAYDMEDVLDEYSYEALHRRIVAESSTSSKVRKFTPTFSDLAIRNNNMWSKIKDINTRLEGIHARKAKLGLDMIMAYNTQSTRERLPPSAFISEAPVHGRADDKEKIMDMLLRDDEHIHTNVSVVSIVAVGGMGKTTLATLVWRDPKISNDFNLMAWAYVSDHFDVEKITSTILSSVTPGSSSNPLKLNEMQDKLWVELKGKKFLVVLDDVWSENDDDWNRLLSPFWSGAPGSKILITTRNKKIAMKMGGVKNLYELNGLSNDECWLVFQDMAFSSINICDHPNLVSIGRKIANKCGGLPLAAKSLGGLLSLNQGEDIWNHVLTGTTWDLPDGSHNIPSLLWLSYKYLPSPLKRCISYCAIFPKDHEFDKNELIRLWMAEGFIQQSRSNIEMEDIGDDYFEELWSRSFFQRSSSKQSHFLMHNLITDLANFVSQEMCIALKNNSEKQQIILGKYRHSSFVRGTFDVFKELKDSPRMEYLRTLVVLQVDASEDKYKLNNKVLEGLLSKLKHLRVLSLSGFWISEIPNSIGKLKHLRYLNLSKTKVKWLPESIGNLHMLETLILFKCERFVRLPLSIGNLINLRYLDVSHTILEGLSPQICNFKNLKMLSTFMIGKDNGLNVKELRDMNHLRERLHISNLENITNVADAKDADLYKKLDLPKLMMSWSDSQNVGNQIDILDSLQPHFGLKKLIIKSYGGLNFSRWLEDVRYSKMEKISLVNCKNCTFLPCLGQLPLLKHLVIQAMDEIKAVGKEFHGKSLSFPLLESLSFLDMKQWEDWEGPSLSESYPHLLRLTIRNCPKLIKELPTYLPYLAHLSVSRCPQLRSPLIKFPSLSKLEIQECDEFVLRNGVDLHVKEQQQLLGNLRFLEISGCVNLEKLPNGLHRMARLEELKIQGCPKLLSFPKSGLPPLLARLVIEDCKGVTCLPDWLTVTKYGSSSNVCILKYLEISKCSSLVCFPEGKLPTTLKELQISECEKLQSLPAGIMQCHDSATSSGDGTLNVLRIQKCSSLEFFPPGKFPSMLRKLDIVDCAKLESISEKMSQSNNTSLESLSIGDYPSLETIPDCLYNLRVLKITACKNLELLPRKLENLQELTIYDCKNLKLPPQQLQTLTTLQSLTIRNSEIIGMPLYQWGLATLTSLKRLTLDGLFPEVTSSAWAQRPLLFLPTTLTYLSIESFQNLKSLTSLNLQTLTYLEDLFIHNCPKLKSFCPKKGLPDNLLRLRISGCPLLSKRCSKGKSRDWTCIAHISRVMIDSKDIFE